MNLLEYYFVEIHGAEEVVRDWGNFIKADVTTICYGVVERKTATFSSWEAFEQAKKDGYYMA